MRSYTASVDSRYKYIPHTGQAGKERDIETGYDYFGARYYDSKIGRWMSVDPASDKSPGFSPYNYSFNNPINFFDPNGLFPNTFYVRSFHPEPMFYRFKGDNRGFSNDPSASSRIAQHFTFDPSNGELSNKGFSFNYSQEYFTKDQNIAIEKPEDTGFNITKLNYGYKLSTGYYGNNPFLPGSPDIDVHSGFTISEDKKSGILSISGSIKGDLYPNTEAFIVDVSGNSLFMGVKVREGIPPLSLPGSGNHPLINISINVSIDNKENFTGVYDGGKFYTLKEWNDRYLNQKPN